MTRSRPTLVRLLPAILWLLGMVTLSSVRLGGLDLPQGADKLLHLAEYAVLALLTLVGLHPGTVRGLFLRACVAVPIMALLAGADELHQRWIPGRSPDSMDLLADLAGIVLGAATAFLVAWIRSRRDTG